MSGLQTPVPPKAELNYILRQAQDLQPAGFRAMYLTVLLIFTGKKRLKFFDVLQVFVLYHGL
jgi:hypothetical protein